MPVMSWLRRSGRALQQCGQRLSAHIRREEKAADMERKLQHIEQFAPILVAGLCRITQAKAARKEKAIEGLRVLLGRDTRLAEKELQEAHAKAKTATKELAEQLGVDHQDLHDELHGEKLDGEKGQMELIEE